MNTPVVTRQDLLAQAARVVPTGASQASGVEQTRAVAQVQAALLVAQSRPRAPFEALRHAKAACGQMAMAERAFFKFSRGGQTVEGPSIHFATELARCWGNIEYSIVELDRDDEEGMSEMLACAWDLETNTRATVGFLVPHTRDTKQGPRRLLDSRDIYENNANAGARRVRECILRVLPRWYVEECIEECRATLERGTGDEPLEVRIAKTITAFANAGISKARLEARMGPAGEWSNKDIASLRVSYRSIQQGEIAADDEFPDVRPAAAEVAESLKARARKQKAPPAQPVPDEVPEVEMEPEAGPEYADDDPFAPAPEDDPFVPAPEDGRARQLYGELLGQIERASSIKELGAVNLSTDRLSGLHAAEIDALRAAWGRRSSELRGGALL